MRIEAKSVWLDDSANQRISALNSEQVIEKSPLGRTLSGRRMFFNVEEVVTFEPEDRSNLSGRTLAKSRQSWRRYAHEVTKTRAWMRRAVLVRFARLQGCVWTPCSGRCARQTDRQRPHPSHAHLDQNCLRPPHRRSAARRRRGETPRRRSRTVATSMPFCRPPFAHLAPSNPSRML